MRCDVEGKKNTCTSKLRPMVLKPPSPKVCADKEALSSQKFLPGTNSLVSIRNKIMINVILKIDAF